MPIAINGSGTITGVSAGGYPDATINTEDLNAGAASAGQKLVAGGASGPMTWGSSIVLGTAQNSTSGTSIDFTGIPSWARRITVMFNGVSTNGTSVPQIQLGSVSFTTSGYSCISTQFVDAGAVSVVAGGGSGLVLLTSMAASYTLTGTWILTLVSANTWSISGALHMTSTARSAFCNGSITLSGTLDRVRITTVNGTDAFDAGSINIQYE